MDPWRKKNVVPLVGTWDDGKWDLRFLEIPMEWVARHQMCGVPSDFISFCLQFLYFNFVCGIHLKLLKVSSVFLYESGVYDISFYVFFQFVPFKFIVSTRCLSYL
jgi:hypothetical protein